MKHSIRRYFTVFVTVAACYSAIGYVGAMTSSAAEPPPATVQKTAQETAQKTEIEADTLITNNEQKYAEFSGTVAVTHGDFKIFSDKLRLYYKGDLVNPEKEKTGDDQIEKIIASGNVDVNSEKFTAKTEKAEYDFKTEILVMTGENTVVTSDKNSITGSVITFNRKTGKVEVLGDRKKRVKVIFFEEGDGADFLKMKKE